MFGKNKVFGVGDFEEGKLLIKEHFYTIQGEGPYMGTPAYFIRFGRCSLKCHFCDTNFEDDLKEMTPQDLVKSMTQQADLIVITGGEPLLQPALVGLCDLLIDKGSIIQIETSGSVCSDEFLRYLDWGQGWGRGIDIVCSPKTGKIVSELLPFITAYKYVVRSGATCPKDGLPVEGAHRLGSKLRLARPHREDLPVYISPMDQYDAEKNEKNFKEAARVVMEHNYLLSLQMHKIVGVP